MVASPQEQHLRTSLTIGYAPSAASARVISNPSNQNSNKVAICHLICSEDVQTLRRWKAVKSVLTSERLNVFFGGRESHTDVNVNIY